ncbi:MAG: Tyrosine-tRNA ligase [Candidatus Yanofskybacteria bacterium GW2011_GWA1_44_21]|uniref:Tyrosine--tRNA ligase n=3 Tax=Parcubacteria group TaxID=1794811 RepID=A0A0G1AIR0_9BACT|nr:MAG: Tyrosine-tRNA ligase [Candidatus Wolfebacteria bacterium GW2011_GWA2_42_10]KKT50325.1 MAG: Tyrosine-tRNA ligase [Candidatus Yanofskybacteria bacterium GW2011_GWA1_44_21]KKT90164.1 MAG: Tyrosine-tRNA ligase [Candidatus Yanofskybacteria bacterium GW2011_GWB1_45_11]OGN03403.1 MAG: tyrosine--tRNA ligase [Candidatus Yanofskybacteria bacterium RIFCSPHIGHO2_01_FULL_44_110b]OGN15004.1 MAG: tyrosine--tRNA ligase [Candidatus Yanofskybacteria bacterium RIFCSPHIGHO2_02_FULL_44_36b]OGN18935.1 MAG: 
MLSKDVSDIKLVLERRLEIKNIFPNFDEVSARLKNESGLRVYLGIDPTGPEIHIGHTIPLLFLKDLLDLGHKPVIVIGTFTALIGDPTGNDSTRKPMTDEQIKQNMATYVKQLEKILPPESFEIKYNGDWLSKLTFRDVIELAGQFSAKQMLARDLFRDRLEKDRPLGFHELLYPLMQGYDSVAMDIDGETGGNDQVFNMVVGRDLMKAMKGKDKMVLPTRLLILASGKKMSKTEGGIISVNDNPEEMFGKTMAIIADEMIADVFQLCTNEKMEWIERRKKETADGGNPKDFKEELAFKLVEMYHGREAAQKAKENFDSVFSKGELPTDMPVYEIKESMANILDVLVSSGLVQSKSEAKRLMDQNGVSINGDIQTKWEAVVKKDDILKIGPRKFLKIK